MWLRRASWLGLTAVVVSACSPFDGYRAQAADTGMDAVDGAEPDADAAGSDAGALPTEGLLLWLRADRAVTEVGGRVSRWADQSPHQSDATQEVPTKRPALIRTGGGLSAVELDGVDDVLDLPGGFADFTGGLTAFVVYVEIGGSPERYVPFIELSNGAGRDVITFGVDHGQLHFAGGDVALTGDVVAPGTPHVVAAHLETWAEGDLFLDAAFILQRSGTSPPALVTRQRAFVGGSLRADAAPFRGRIFEVLIYARRLTDPERESVTDSLQARWGVSDFHN